MESAKKLKLQDLGIYNKKPFSLKNFAILIGKYLILCLLACIFILPFFLMIAYSVLPDVEALNGVVFSETNTINIGTYLTILNNQKYMQYFSNTLFVGVIVAVGTPLASSLCAFGFTKLKFPGRDLVFSITLMTMMLPGIATQLPLYLVYEKIDWLNTLYPLYIPTLFGGGALNIFLMSQFMRGIPSSLYSAGKIDGASDLRIYFQIMLPLCKPIFLYVMVTAFMGSWNDFTTPLIYIDNPELYTLSIGIFKDYGGSITANNLPNMSSAAGVIMMLPCLIIFFIFQKSLIDGVMVSGLKG